MQSVQFLLKPPSSSPQFTTFFLHAMSMPQFISTPHKTLRIESPFTLESGIVLPRLDIAYHTYGTMNATKDNVVWVCHALTGNSDAAVWWDGLIGAGKLFDFDKYYIVCANMLGSCYGSSGATSLNTTSSEPYYREFPQITTRDMAHAHRILRKALGVERIAVGLGGSMGGQQLLEWAIVEPTVFDTIIPMATNAQHSPWGIAFNESQRLALEADATFFEDRLDAGLAGLKAARAIGILSYRNYDTFLKTQAESGLDDKTDGFRAASYQAYQGEKLTQRFNAHTYWHLTKAMDSHNVGRFRGGIQSALAQIQARTFVVGISTDILFPPDEQRLLAEYIPNADYIEITSPYGHDGFLIEFATLTTIIQEFLTELVVCA
jgi:homoserine O-acetyltransferase/O-succinyltransferase